jgi:4-alpha-glucanotransferase
MPPPRPSDPHHGVIDTSARPPAGPPDPALESRALGRGIVTSYVDAWGRHVGVPVETLEALLVEVRPATDRPIVAEPGTTAPALAGRVVCADGTETVLTGGLPSDFPLGYHRLHTTDGERLLVVCPSACRLPDRGWGWAAQLYSARTERSWGIGDLADLADLADRAAADGASMLLVSPLHAAHPGPVQQDSPYSPTSRQWLAVNHVAIEAVPGAETVDLDDLRSRALALNARRLIDRDEVWVLKRTALERIWAAVRADEPAPFAAWVGEHGAGLRRFATWMALAERFGGPWWDWPAPYRHPDGPAVARFADEHADRVRFHAWCQWVADQQLAAACRRGVDVVLDLAIGVDAGGADAWAWQDHLAFGFETGVPPSLRNADGQRWGLPPFDPGRLAAVDYEPFVATVRAALRHAAGLRVDHVMGLWRLFWVPSGGDPRAGAYVRNPGDDWLGILRLEAHRAGAWLVGEDLGYVEETARAEMARTGILGYRVSATMDAADFPEASLASFATHDQATVVGLLTGSDAADQDAIGKGYDRDAAGRARTRLATLTGLDPDGPYTADDLGRAIEAVHEELAASASLVVVATLDDAGAVRERPNMPGTVDTWPNWRLALPAPVAEVLDAPVARRIVEAFDRAGRSRRRPGG